MVSVSLPAPVRMRRVLVGLVLVPVEPMVMASLPLPPSLAAASRIIRGVLNTAVAKKVMPEELPKKRLWPAGEAGLSMVTVSVALGVTNVKEEKFLTVTGS